MRLVILDRDGVINEDSETFVKSPAEWRPIPGSLEAIARLNRAGYRVVVCTNQSGLARGLLDRTELAAIHEKMCRALRDAGGELSGIFVCPHGPSEGCECRKPRPGLLRQAAERLHTTLAGIPVIGDSARDLEAAEAAGARPILVLTGNGRRTLESLGGKVPEMYADLRTAAEALAEEIEDSDDGG